MNSSDRRNITIGQLMVVVAATALLVGLLTNPDAARSASLIGGFLGLIFVVVATIIAVVDLALSVRCPRCGEWTMARVSVTSFRDRFYRCNSCQTRCRRGFLRGWDDASDREFDPIYARKRPENPWTALPGVEDEDMIYSKTHVNLLLNKQRRNPNAPNQGEGAFPEPRRDSEPS